MTTTAPLIRECANIVDGERVYSRYFRTLAAAQAIPGHIRIIEIRPGRIWRVDTRDYNGMRP